MNHQSAFSRRLWLMGEFVRPVDRDFGRRFRFMRAIRAYNPRRYRWRPSLVGRYDVAKGCRNCHQRRRTFTDFRLTPPSQPDAA